MSSYDFIGKDKYAVECFTVPCINVEYNGTNNIPTVQFGAVGGRMKHYTKEVPHVTKYYNYTKDFIIVDYHWGIEPPCIHIIKDGCYDNTFAIDEISENYGVYFSTAIDYYGKKLNVSSVDEVREMVRDYTEILENSKPCGNNKSFEHKVVNEHVAIDNYNKIMKPFIEKWYAKEEDEDFKILGMVLDGYEYWIREGARYDFMGLEDDDWYTIFNEANEMLIKCGSAVDKYFEWCAKNGIEVDKHMAKVLFETYVLPTESSV